VKYSGTAVSAFWPVLLRVGLLVIPLGYAGLLLWQEWVLREVIVRESELPVPPAAVISARPVLNPAAVATVLGLGSENAPVRSAEPLTLRASFVSSTGESRALLAGPEGERLYTVGERLPGGSVLRRVDIVQAVLWRNGREELLPLLNGARALRRVNAEGPNLAPGPALLYLRPAADLPPSK